MVSQLHWEDDVVWNGDDIKHKVAALRMIGIVLVHYIEVHKKKKTILKKNNDPSRR